MRVVKIGGNELDRPDSLARFGAALKSFQEPVVVVHGGGARVSAQQTRLGIEPRKLEGLRITDAATLEVVIMVLGGLVNRRLAADLYAAGVRAVGLSGVDGGLLRCRPLTHPGGELGFVGDVTGVDARLLVELLKAGFTPLVAPLALGEDGQIYNLNADSAAGAIAHALRARQLDFVSDVPGIVVDAQVLEQLEAQSVQVLIEQGDIHGGMLPKVRAAIEALAAGVPAVRITDLPGLLHGAGTRIHAAEALRAGQRKDA